MAELWEIAKKRLGKPPSFNSPEEMLALAYEYFQWCKDNPINEPKPFTSQGEIIYGVVSKMRAMTQEGLYTYMGISKSTWHNYQNNPLYLDVTSHINDVMREQKFTGAAAGVLNPNIIARDLGLKDASEVDHKSTDGSMRTYSPDDYKAAHGHLASNLKELD